mgnify:FL=1
MYARWIAMPKNSNSGSDLATYIASNAELLTEQNYTDIDALVFAEIIHRGGTDEEGEVFTNKYLTAGVRQ